MPRTSPAFSRPRVVTLLIAVLATLVPILGASGAFAATGDLDPSFGVGGKVVTDRGDDFLLYDGTQQPDGKTLVVGEVYPFPSKRVLGRYNTDGSLDTGFGTGGFADLALSAYGWWSDLAVQPDSKIVVVGNQGENQWALARYTSAGVLDPSFGTGGVVITDVGATADKLEAVAIQPDGAIVVAGRASFPSPCVCAAVGRYTSAGVLDGSFGAAASAGSPAPGSTTCSSWPTARWSRPAGATAACCWSPSCPPPARSTAPSVPEASRT